MPAESDHRVRVRATTVCRAALLGMILLLIATAYYPFGWDPLRMVRNDVTRSSDGAMRFGEMNRARTPGTPSWLRDARTSGTVQIQLHFEPQSLREHASIMMLASDFWNTDFAIGQDHSDLLVWLRRPGSDGNGDPPFVVEGVVQPQRWNHVGVIVQRNHISIHVDGRTRLIEHLPPDPLRVWGQGQIALGGEVHGGGPWQGRIRHAEVRTSGQVIDYVQPGALSIPRSYLYFPDHVQPFTPTNLEDWLHALLHLLSFIPVGFLIVLARRPPVRPVPATLIAAVLAVVLAGGKFLFHARHTSVADIVVQVGGALLGALLASRLARAHAARSARTTGEAPAASGPARPG
jgi:VanZ family protein